MKKQYSFHRRIPLALGLACAMWPQMAFAASGEGFPRFHWAVSMVNFVIFLGILVYFAGPKIQSFFAQRRSLLVAELEAAKKLREEAQARLDEYQKRMDSLESERKELMNEYHVQGEREKERLVADAKRQVEKMRADAELVIHQELRKAVASIEAQAIDSAMHIAEESLKKKLDDRQQNALVSQYVQDLKSFDAEAN